MQLDYVYIQVAVLKGRRIKKKSEWREELLKERQHVELECSRCKCTDKLVYAQGKRREIKEEGRIIRKASRGARMLALYIYK